MERVGIRILGAGTNGRGDLFTRLCRDLLFALGYDGLRRNVHKPGRELDLQGEHRFEPRRVVAECRATAAKVGGDSVNKFLGVLTRERSRHAPTPVVGYFVSLAGFTATAVEQEEEESSEAAVILLDGESVIAELERGRVIVERAVATERAGHCAQHGAPPGVVLDRVELLGHESGYLWAVYYAHDKVRTHFALIHADGAALAQGAAEEVVEADRSCGGPLGSLSYLPPAASVCGDAAVNGAAITAYNRWVAEEYGFIYLDGLPTDNELGATRLKLERLFVPLRAMKSVKGQRDSSYESDAIPIGSLLQQCTRLALLAPPGGGKSTLLMRLATAYAFPERRAEVPDDLPELSGLPIVLRCRELRERAHRPILELIDDIPVHAGMDDLQRAAFRHIAHEAIRNGSALLLVDGLDEISDEGARRLFASRLRTFVATFPRVRLVVTSREAGFRLVAGTIASVCTQARLAPLSAEDAARLCEQWHVEVFGNTDKVRVEAGRLAREIWNDSRIRALAVNPLLLTTLFVVKRSAGELPRSRAALYREAIKVLVRTWNIEGYAPLDEDETLAQLSYVSCAMFQAGKQQIGAAALLALLQNARRELEAELQFATVSPAQFIERIEYRSSLLMQVGHIQGEHGTEPVYEFRHLTFQEYLAARGYVEEQYLGRNGGQDLTAILEPHFGDSSWQEVICLAAVLAGRRAENLIVRLTEACDRDTPAGQRHSTGSGSRVYPRIANLLYRCLCNEVQVTQRALRPALLRVAREIRGMPYSMIWPRRILQNKCGSLFRESVEQAYFSSPDNLAAYLEAMVGIARLTAPYSERRGPPGEDFERDVLNALGGDDRLQKVRAALASAMIAQEEFRRLDDVADREAVRTRFGRVYRSLARTLEQRDPYCNIASCRALAMIGGYRLGGVADRNTLLSMFEVWRDAQGTSYARYPAQALAAQRLLPRHTFADDPWGDCDELLTRAAEWRTQGVSQQAALIVGWYRRRPWSDLEIAQRLRVVMSLYAVSTVTTAVSLLEALGDAGQEILAQWRARVGTRKHSFEKISDVTSDRDPPLL